MVKDREAWRAAGHGVAKSQTQQQLTVLPHTFETSDKSKTTEVFPYIYNVIPCSNECFEKQESREMTENIKMLSCRDKPR